MASSCKRKRVIVTTAGPGNLVRMHKGWFCIFGTKLMKWSRLTSTPEALFVSTMQSLDGLPPMSVQFPSPPKVDEHADIQ